MEVHDGWVEALGLFDVHGRKRANVELQGLDVSGVVAFLTSFSANLNQCDLIVTKDVRRSDLRLHREDLALLHRKSIWWFPQVLRIRNRLSGKVLPIDDWHRQHALKVVRRKGESKPLGGERGSESWLSRIRRGRCACGCGNSRRRQRHYTAENSWK